MTSRPVCRGCDGDALIFEVLDDGQLETVRVPVDRLEYDRDAWEIAAERYVREKAARPPRVRATTQGGYQVVKP